MIGRKNLFAACATFALLWSCGGDDVQFADPPKRTPDPNAAQAAPTGGGALPPGHPPVSPPSPHPAPTTRPSTHAPAAHDPFADEGGGASVASTAQDPKALALGGTITMGEGSVAPQGTFSLFVSLVEGPTGRMPILSKRFDNPTFPFAFELLYGDNPTNATVDPKASLHVRAQLSTTGDVMRSTHRTTSTAPITLGARDFTLALKQ